MLKRTAIVLLTILFCISFSWKAGAQEPPNITAESAVLMDHETKRILYAKDPILERPVASTTKIMTAVLGLEYGELGENINISSTAAHTGGSSIWLEEGERKTLEELLLGLMMRSGNDAAVAIAEHISGGNEDFALLMNKKAKELGAENTSFRNPHGLHHPDHYSTAYDMALITAHAMSLEEFRRIITTPSTVISWPGHPWDRHLYNQNKLLRLYDGAEGVKTGWTTPAGRCFVGAAYKKGRRLITVVLNAPDMWEDTIALLDFGFENFTSRELINKNQYLKSIPVIKGVTGKVEAHAAKNFNYPLGKSENEQVSYRFNIDDPLEAPLQEGERIGELEIYFDGEIVGFVDLLAGSDVEKLSWWRRFISFWWRRS